LKYDLDVLKSLARRSGGDCRAAINDLEIVSCITKKVNKDSLESFGDRDRLEAIQSALVKILKNTDPATRGKRFRRLTANPSSGLHAHQIKR